MTTTQNTVSAPDVDEYDDLDAEIKNLGIEDDGLNRGKRPTRRPLPPIVSADSLLAMPLQRPPELIAGILHKGSKLVLGGASKTNKTWSLLDMAISVASGIPWWGFPTTQGRVLYLNFEIPDWAMRDRCERVSQAKLGAPGVAGLDIWNLRGHAASLGELAGDIIKRAKGCYGLIVFDPIYKCLGERDENNAGDITGLCNIIENIAVETGAAVVYAAHFSKGGQAGKNSIDRISGSGVWARDPDAILTLTPHEQEGAYVVEATLRNFKPLPAFTLEWGCPLMKRVGLDPTRLRKAGGRNAKYNRGQLLACLPPGGLNYTDWRTKAMDEIGMSEGTFKNKFKELRNEGAVLQEGDIYKPLGVGVVPTC